jgi:hypothetical protein
MDEQEKKNRKWLVNSLYVAIGVVVAVLLFIDNTNDNIINYPHYVMHYLWIAMSVILVIAGFRWFGRKYMSYTEMNDRLYFAGACLVGIIIGGGVLAGMICTPLNLYNKHVALLSKADSVVCNIDSVSIGEGTEDKAIIGVFHYKFNNQPNELHTDKYLPAIATMHEFHSTMGYRLKLAVHKALLDSYLLEGWKLVKTVPDTTGKKR